jgi:hypothetical protein
LLPGRIYSIGQFYRVAFCLAKKANEGRERRINMLNGSFLALRKAGQLEAEPEKRASW